METWMEMIARCWNQDRECERVWKVFCQGGRFGAGLNVNMAFVRFFSFFTFIISDLATICNIVA